MTGRGPKEAWRAGRRSTRMGTRARQPAHFHGFTLIELLVVIAVIGLLVAIALPALASARRSGDQARESSALRQVCLAYTVYAQDHRGVLLPGYVPVGWVLPPPVGDPARQIEVYSNAGVGQSRLYGSVARRYTWRLAPYLEYAREAIVVDKQLRADFSALPDRPSGRDGFQWAFGSCPSFGMNTTFVGGDSRRGGFFQPSLARWGSYYVTRLDEPIFPDRLLIFATSRGYHPHNGSLVIPGRHRIEGPWRASRVPSAVPTFSPWAAPAGPFDRSRTPTTYGHLDFRHFQRAIVGTFDGHVEPLKLDDLRDMRRWSNQATSPDWQPQ